MVSFNELKEGDFRSKKIIFSEDIVNGFLSMSGDINRIHRDEDFAKKTRFGKRIVPGFLYILQGTELFFELCGNNYVLKNFSVSFLKPVFFDDELYFVLKIDEKNKERKEIKLSFEGMVGESLVTKGEYLAKYFLEEDS